LDSPLLLKRATSFVLRLRTAEQDPHSTGFLMWPSDNALSVQAPKWSGSRLAGSADHEFGDVETGSGEREDQIPDGLSATRKLFSGWTLIADRITLLEVYQP